MSTLVYFILAFSNIPFLLGNVNAAMHAETSAQLFTCISFSLISAFALGWCSAFGTIKVIQKLLNQRH